MRSGPVRLLGRYLPDAWSAASAAAAVIVFLISAALWDRRAEERTAYASGMASTDISEKTRYLRRAFDLSGGLMPGPLALIELGKVQIASGDLRGALSTLLITDEFFPDRSHAWKALALIRADRNDEALAMLTRAINGGTLCVKTYLLAGMLYLHKGARGVAMAHFHKGWEIDPAVISFDGRMARAQELLIEGEDLLKSGQAAPAAVAFSDALVFWPDSKEAMRGRVRAYYSAGKVQNAMIALWTYSDRLGHLPDISLIIPDKGLPGTAGSFLPSSRLERGDELFLLNRHEEALRQYEQAIQESPQNPVPRYHRAVLLEKLGKDREAMEATDALLHLTPMDDNAVLFKSRLLAKEGRIKQALEQARKARFLPGLWESKLLVLAKKTAASTAFRREPSDSSTEAECLAKTANDIDPGQDSPPTLKVLEARINLCLDRSFP